MPDVRKLFNFEIILLNSYSKALSIFNKSVYMA